MRLISRPVFTYWKQLFLLCQGKRHIPQRLVLAAPHCAVDGHASVALAELEDAGLFHRVADARDGLVHTDELRDAVRRRAPPSGA